MHAADEAAQASAAVQQGQYDHGLGPYPQDGVEARWRQLCRHVTARTLERAGVPIGTRVVPGDAAAADDTPGVAQHDQLTPFFASLARTPRFSPVAARRLAGMTAAEVRASGARHAVRRCTFRADTSQPSVSSAHVRLQVTAYNLRPELRLARLLSEEYGGEPCAMLGEFELAFVLFLLLSSLPAFEHWKAALHLVRAPTNTCGRVCMPVVSKPACTERAHAPRCRRAMSTRRRGLSWRWAW